MANRTVENLAGFAVHSWIFAFVGTFIGLMFRSSLIISLSNLLWPLFTIGWVYVFLDALGVIGNGTRKTEWALGIFFLGGICAPLYWWKQIYGYRAWAAYADDV